MAEPASPDSPDAEENEAEGSEKREDELAEADAPSVDEAVPIDPVPVTMAQATQQLSQAKAGPTASSRRVRVPARSIAAVGIVLVAAAGATYLALQKSPGSTDAASASATTIPGPMPGAPKTPVNTSTSVPAGAVPAGGAPAGGAPAGGAPAGGAPNSRTPTALQPSNPSHVKAWNAGPAGTALTQVTTLSGNALMANAGQQYADMLRSCKGLSSAVSSAQQAAPIQDAAMQKEYAAALSSLRLGAEDCMTSIKQVSDGVEDTVINVDHATLNTAVTELSTGSSELYAATETLRK